MEEASGRSWAEWDEAATARGAAHLAEMVGRRRAGEPLQYVIGHWPFRGLDLLVDRRVLIPRPETEVVAGVAIAEAMAGRRAAGAQPGPFRVADLGTGSGALALALACELPGAEVWATDIEPGALDVASANLAGCGQAATRVRLAQGSWFEALPAELAGQFRLIVSNPPYVSAAEHAGLAPDVRDHEPVAALVPGPDGTEALEHLVAEAPRWLEPGGVLVLELAPHQAGPLRLAALGQPGWDSATIHPDLAGRARALALRKLLH